MHTVIVLHYFITCVLFQPSPPTSADTDHGSHRLSVLIQLFLATLLPQQAQVNESNCLRRTWL